MSISLQLMRFDLREEVLNSENFKPRWVAAGTILLNCAFVVTGFVLFRVAPRSPGWPPLAEFVGFYVLSAAIALALWRHLVRDILRRRILQPGSLLGYLDLSMTMTALFIIPLILFFAVNALLEFF